MAKVCILTLTECRGSVDARVLKEARTLKQAGHDIRIIASRRDKSLKPYEDMNGLRVFRVKAGTDWLDFFRRLYFSRSDEIATNIKEGNSTEGLESTTPSKRLSILPKTFLRKLGTPVLQWLVGIYRALYIGYLLYFLYFYRSFWVARRERADVYHAHDLMTMPVAWLLSRLHKAKLVYDSHELWLDRNRVPKRSRLNRFFIRQVEAYLIKRSDAVITVSEPIADELSKWYHIPRPKVIVNAPDYRPVERSNILREKIGIPVDEKIILYIGAIIFNRGLEELILSLRYLKGYCLVLMGYSLDDYSTELKKLTRKERLEDRVYFFGPVPHEEVTRYAASADLGAVPIKNACLSYYYCSPNKLFECVAAGLPVVGSNFPELKRVIEENQVGLTFDPESPQDIARAIDCVLSDKNRYEEMRKNALEAAKIYNWQIESKKLVDVYERLSWAK